MSAKNHKALMQNFWDEINKRERPIDEIMVDYHSADYRSHTTWKDRAGACKVLRELTEAYPDLTSIIQDMLVEDDKIAVRIKHISKNKTISALSIFRIAGGKIVEHWGHSDSFF